MPIATWGEVRWAVIGCLRLARGDRAGLDYFDRSLDGFWRSFLSAVLCYPLFLLLLTMRVSLADWRAAGGVQIVLVETIGYVISWVAFPLVMLSVLRGIGRAHRFFDFLVPYNWCQLPQSALFALVGLASESGVLGDPLAQTIEVAAGLAVLVYEWYIARVALEASVGAAILVVIVDLALGIVISRAAQGLY